MMIYHVLLRTTIFSEYQKFLKKVIICKIIKTKLESTTYFYLKKNKKVYPNKNINVQFGLKKLVSICSIKINKIKILFKFSLLGT